MAVDLSRQPSNIARAVAEFLATVELPDSALPRWRSIFELFFECLQSDPSAGLEVSDEKRLQRCTWADCSGEAMSHFIECWLPARGFDRGAQSRATQVLNAWIRWCYDHNFFDKDCRDVFLSALSDNDKLEVRRLREAAELFGLLHTPLPNAWKTGEYDKVVCLKAHKQPEECRKGFMTVHSLGEESVYLQDSKGNLTGPALVGKALARILKIGDVIDMTIGRYGKFWHVLDSGQIFAEDLIKPEAT